MIKIVIEPGMTWGNLAYKYLGSSSKFRDLLDANPDYFELDQPQPGDIVNIPVGLSSPATRNRSLDSVTRGVRVVRDNIYPWNSLTNYINRLDTYHAFALNNIEECNGDSLDPATKPYVPETETIADITQTGVVNFNLLS